jgi:outer membrane protein OmpA-like peptidoglycan-associated protein
MMNSKHLMIPALLAASVALAACSTPPNANLEQARSNYSGLQANPQASKVAALETKEASDYLDKADKAYLDKEDQAKVDQLAYLTNQRVEVAKQTIALRTAEANLKNASAQRAQARLDARDQQIKQLQDSLNAKQTDRGTLVTFGDVLFATDKAELKSNGLMNINKLAQYLQENPDRKAIVEGYTDSTGTASHNQSLSERRASSVRTALVKMGVDPARIVAQGYGKEYPVADNTSVSGRAQNRRVEVTISNDNQPVMPRSAVSSYTQ